MSKYSNLKLAKTDDSLSVTFNRSWYNSYNKNQKNGEKGGKKKENRKARRNRSSSSDSSSKRSKKSEASSSSSTKSSKSSKSTISRKSTPSTSGRSSSKSSRSESSQTNKIDTVKENILKDDDCEKRMARISGINKFIRYKLKNRIDARKKKEKEKEKEEVKTDSSPSSPSDSPTYKKVDHNGLPLSHPLAVTPFPGATSARKREKARQLLSQALENGLKETADNSTKSEKSEKSKSSSSKSSSSSKKRLSDKRSSELRQKGRDALKVLAQRQMAENKETEKKSDSSRSEKKSSKTTDVVSSATEKQRKFCHHCGACRQCAKKCMNSHHNVSDVDREKFNQGIKQLRKKIQNPESKRHRRTKSPFDVTQSSSDCAVSSKKQKQKKSRKVEKS